MVFVKIPAGQFRMGVTRGSGDKQPAHDVTISRPFCLGAYEVTQRQFAFVTGSNPSHHQGDDLPVENVTWQDAQDFLALLRKSDKMGRYRLPTEAEWEYAARGGKEGPYGFGDDESLLPRYGNCVGGRDGFEGTAPVGRFLGAAWHLHDMHGNVSEWVQDWYGSYSPEPATDPAGPSEGLKRARRGGSFRTSAEHCQAVARNSALPDKILYDVGFRVVRDPIRLP